MANYEMILHKQVNKFLAIHTEISERAYTSFDKISLFPTNPDLDIKPLQGLQFCYRLRIGKYRFLYRIIEEKKLIYVYDVGSRGDI